MTEEERYLFDLQGYLVVRGALSGPEIDAVNRVIDEVLPSWDAAAKVNGIITGQDEEVACEENTDPALGPVAFYAGRLLDWGEPVRRLVGHRKVLPYLSELVGSTLRLDHQYAILMKAHGSSLPLHGGATPYHPTTYYHFRDDRFFNGLTVASFALTDVPPGQGGFCCIPGSHKSNVSLPPSFKQLGEPAECVVHPALRAGDVLLFTEALTHGTLPWTAAHERRALLFKYCPGHMVWQPGSPTMAGDHRWEEHQKPLLRLPYDMA